jgi:hypothetical protein
MSKTVVGKLYMIGCGHCDALNEPWNQMKKKVNKKVIIAGDIEAAQTNELHKLNKQHGANVVVQGGYPTIYKINKGGKVEYYNGERTAAKLVSWALQGVIKQSVKKCTKHKKIGGGKNRKRTKTSKNK